MYSTDIHIMKKSTHLITLLAVLLTALFSTLTFANSDKVEPEDLAKYVSINIEIKELTESGVILKDATENLSQSLNEASKNIDDLSPEQLVLINSLADKIDGITEKLNSALNNIPNTIKNAQKPSSELLQHSLRQIREETITPIVSKIETWLLITIIGLCVLGIGLLIACAYCMKHIGNLGSTLKNIADGYRVIPIEQYNNEVKK